MLSFREGEDLWSESRCPRSFLGDALRDLSLSLNEPRISNMLVDELLLPVSVGLTEFLQLKMRSVDCVFGLMTKEFLCEVEVATEFLVATEPLRPSIFLENVELVSHVSAFRFWKAQSCRKILICPV